VDSIWFSSSQNSFKKGNNALHSSGVRTSLIGQIPSRRLLSRWKYFVGMPDHDRRFNEPIKYFNIDFDPVPFPASSNEAIFGAVPRGFRVVDIFPDFLENGQ
jgi:hypothetical protein